MTTELAEIQGRVLIRTGFKIDRRMKKIMHILFLSCLKATELIEKKF